MKKLLIGLVLSAGVVMASDMPKDDLLSMATMGKTTGTQFEMNNDEMKDVDGGYVGVQNGYQALLSGYKPARKTYTSKKTYTRYYSNGSSYSWSTSTYGGYTWMNY